MFFTKKTEGGYAKPDFRQFDLSRKIEALGPGLDPGFGCFFFLKLQARLSSLSVKSSLLQGWDNTGRFVLTP
jgi:hypothetical protein